jgi:outer membrane protein assembly factor BamB/tetratricopeptide (TPR) repeat protein
MILPLLGRRDEARALEEVLTWVRGGERVMVAVRGSPGSGKSRLIDEWAPRLEEAGLEVRRAAGFAAGETHPGLVARQLGLDEEVEGEGVRRGYLLDDIHWADPTSIGLLQRSISDPGGAGLLIVVTHRPMTGGKALALQLLADTARRRGEFVSLGLEALAPADLAGVVENGELPDRLVRLTGGLPQELEELIAEWIERGVLQWKDGKLEAVGPLPETWERGGFKSPVGLERPGRRLVEAAALAGRPLSLTLTTELMQTSREEVLELGERLSQEGYLRQTAEGFVPASNVAAQRIAEEIGEVRRSALFGELADAMIRLGLAEGEPGLIGSYLLDAARWNEALPLLAQAGLGAVQQQALGEALPLLDGALAALQRSGKPDPTLEGRLRLGRAQCYRLAGWPDLAAEDVAVAAASLSGVEQVQAFGFASAVADDGQHVQEAERYAALGQLEAVRAGQPAMQGSLLTLQARELSRLGFPDEAEAALGKGNRLLELHGDAFQRFRGRDNAAWIAYDQGRAREAEAAFAALAEEAPRLGGVGLAADKEAWWARALFQSGHPERALQVREQALQHADQAASSGPVFLSSMALAEGAEAYGQYEAALEAADEMLGLVLQQLPAWENAARYLRARALLGLGRLEEAAVEIRQAVELCPPGSDGWRWRLKCRASQLEIDAARGEPFPSAEAIELTDQLLQAQWYQTAAELMAVRAKQEGVGELARDAVALGVQLGTPMTAAEAAHAGGLWDDPAGRAVVAEVKSLEHRLPDHWKESWRRLPWVAAALEAPEVTKEDFQEASTHLMEQLEAALAEVGLGDPERLLSPAQRRAAGLVRRRPRRRSPVAVAAVAAAVVVLGGLAGLGGARLLGAGQTVIIEQTLTPTTAPLTLEQTQLPAPADNFGAGWNYRGDASTYATRTGVSTRSGVPDVAGYFWTFDTQLPVRSSPALHGRWVLVGSGNDLYVIDTRTREVLWTEGVQGAIDGPPTVAQAATGEGTGSAVVYFGSRDGSVYGLDVLRGLEAMPSFRTGGQVVSAPLVVDGVVYVGATDGQLYAFDAVNGQEIWPPFPTGDAILGSPAYADGIVYVASMDGKLYGIDASTGQPSCESTDVGGIPTTPVVVSDMVLVGSSAQDLWEFRAAGCGLSNTYNTGTPVEVSPAVSDGVMYVPSGRFLLAIRQGSDEDLWTFDDAEQAIQSAPVVANGVVYVGSDDGNLYAINGEDGSMLWKWQTGGAVRSSPAVADGAVFFGSFDGLIYAVGGA